MKIPSKKSLQKIKIYIRKNTTVEDAIQNSFHKFKTTFQDLLDNYLNEEEEMLIMKINGIESYLFPTNKVIDYENIRLLLRKRANIELELIKIIKNSMLYNKKYPAQDLFKNEEIYRNKINQEALSLSSTATILNPDELYLEILKSSNSNSYPYIPKDYLKNQPFKLRIIGLDNVNKLSIPKLNDVNNVINEIFIETYLYIGNQRLSLSLNKTDTKSVLQQSPRWYKWYISSKVNLSSLPSYTRLAFLIFGKKQDNPDKNILLAYNSINLFDQNGLLIMGKHSFNCWTNPFSTIKKNMVIIKKKM